jgi:hypothetical protein
VDVTVDGGRPRPESDRRCAYCHDLLARVVAAVCPLCETRLHLECLAHLAQCPTIGCTADFHPAAKAARAVLERAAPVPASRPGSNAMVPAAPPVTLEDDPDDDPVVRARSTFDPAFGMWRSDPNIGAGIPSSTDFPGMPGDRPDGAGDETGDEPETSPRPARPTDGRCPTCQGDLSDGPPPAFCYHCGEAFAASTDDAADDDDDDDEDDEDA